MNLRATGDERLGSFTVAQGGGKRIEFAEWGDNGMEESLTS